MKAPLAGDLIGPSPVHRGRLGSKRSVMTDGGGYPISIIMGPANTHDSKMLADTIAARILQVTAVDLVLDRGYQGKPAEEICTAAGFTRILPSKKLEELAGRFTHSKDPRQKGRWMIERTFAWLHAFRGLEQRLEKKAANHLALLHFWAALVWWRRLSKKMAIP